MVGERSGRSRQEVSLRLSPAPVMAIKSFAAASLSFVKFLKWMKPKQTPRKRKKQSIAKQSRWEFNDAFKFKIPKLGNFFLQVLELSLSTYLNFLFCVETQKTFSWKDSKAHLIPEPNLLEKKKKKKAFNHTERGQISSHENTQQFPFSSKKENQNCAFSL